MFDRLFGRHKDEPLEPACALCGRTLLPGEWAQTVVTEDGREDVVCSLCAHSQLYADTFDKPATGEEPESAPAAGPIPVVGHPQPIKPRPSREDSDAFWRALKEKDAEIARLQSELVRAEAEKQELAAQLARLHRVTGAAAGAAAAGAPVTPPTGPTAAPDVPSVASAATEPIVVDGDFDHEAEVGAEFERSGEPAAAAPDEPTPPVVEAAEPAAAAGGDAISDTAEMPAVAVPPPRWVAPERVDENHVFAEVPPEERTFIDEPLPQTGLPLGDFGAEEVHAQPTAALVATGQPAEPAPAVTSAPLFAHSDEPAASADEDEETAAIEVPAPDAGAASPSAAELAEQAASLTLLQRGVDLLNVSVVPRKVADTSESLGIPAVHVACDNDTLTAVFLWSMAWYEYRVDLAGSGDVELVERGYEDRGDVRPNAKVRPDGTVQLAPAAMRRPVASASDTASAAAEEPKPTVPGSGDIISKSLKGQRTDDAAVDWDRMSARDFDWGG
jgi:hypothetical protein